MATGKYLLSRESEVVSDEYACIKQSNGSDQPILDFDPHGMYDIIELYIHE